MELTLGVDTCLGWAGCARRLSRGSARDADTDIGIQPERLAISANSGVPRVKLG
jgi:hypothetical protein